MYQSLHEKKLRAMLADPKTKPEHALEATAQLRKLEEGRQRRKRDRQREAAGKPKLGRPPKAPLLTGRPPRSPALDAWIREEYPHTHNGRSLEDVAEHFAARIAQCIAALYLSPGWSWDPLAIALLQAGDIPLTFEDVAPGIDEAHRFMWSMRRDIPLHYINADERESFALLTAERAKEIFTELTKGTNEHD